VSDATKEFGLEMNAEKTKYMTMSRHQKARQNYNLLTAKTSLKTSQS